jgi:glycosyltransferase involved in cell wall biosynthesis
MISSAVNRAPGDQVGSSPTPAITVVLSVHNGVPYLTECINSVLQQDFPNFELIIGDDGSTDETLALVTQYQDPRIRLVRNRSRQGLFPTLNRLLDTVRSLIVQFLCHDDVLEPHCLSVVTRFFAEHASVEWAFCKYTLMDAFGHSLLRATLHDMPDVLDGGLCTQLFLYYGCIPGNLSSVSARTASLRHHAGFDQSFSVSGDYDTWTRLCADAPTGVIHDHLVRVRSHAGQMTKAADSDAKSVGEERRILWRLVDAMPLARQRYARFYILSRWDVLHANRALHLVGLGKIKQALHIQQAMGLGHFGVGLLFWLLTANNRLYRPDARFVYR